MKKGLLIAIAALFVAVGANAQYVRVAQTSKMLPLSGNATKEMNYSVKQDVTIANSKFSLSRRAASVDGTYIMESDDSTDEFTFLSNKQFTIESSTGTITLDQYEGSPSFDYNVVLNDFAYSGGVAYGFYNEEVGFIEIPSQTIFKHATYGPFVLSGAYEPGDGYIHFGKEIILLPNEDGGFDLYPDVEEGGDEATATTGWAIYFPEYGSGTLASVGHDVAFYAPNAIMSSDVSGNLRTDGKTSGWQDDRAEYPVYVEDFESEYVVHNFAGMAAISITINKDGTCQIPLPQYVDDYSYEDGGFVYGCMRLVGLDLDGEYIVRNYDKTSLPGFVKEEEGGKLLDFFELTTEGKVLQDETHSPYLSIATGADASGSAYSMGAMFAIRIAIPTVDPTGISEVDNANKAATAKTYNMLCQQVNAGAKGLLIRNGKKFIGK